MLEDRGLKVHDDIVAPAWYFDDEPDPGMVPNPANPHKILL